jgi:putative transposase
LALIRELQLANYEAYGSRMTWFALRRAGHEAGRDRVARLMRRAGIRGAKGCTKRWQTTQPELVRRLPDLVERRFEASGPDELWVADFTYLRSWQGVVFLSFVIDVWSRRVVGWQFASNMRTSLVLDALRMALSQRRYGADVELVHHSDRGSQYLSYNYTQVLADHGVLASCGSVGDAYDNALAESCRHRQDRADPRPRVVHPEPTRARDRRLHRLVQPRPPARGTRRPAPSRVRSARADRDPAKLTTTSTENHKTESPWNPVRLNSRSSSPSEGRATP